MRLHPSGDYDTGGRSGDFSVVRRPDRHMARSQFVSERTLKRSNGWNDVKRVECSVGSVELAIVDEVDGQIYNSGGRWQSVAVLAAAPRGAILLGSGAGAQPA